MKSTGHVMNRIIGTAIGASVLTAIGLLADAQTEQSSAYDFDAMLALDQAGFDQDMDGGWRPLAKIAGCEQATADLIKTWRETNGDKVTNAGILYWHEGQMAANANDYNRAIAAFENARNGQPDWDHYVDASLAFLKRDKPRLMAVRDVMAALPEPFYWPQVVARFEEQFGRTPTWPNNLDVVDGLVTCFDRSYREAYGPQCRVAAPELADPTP